MSVHQPNWDKYETALLIEAYWKIKAAPKLKRIIARSLSSTLRERASFEIDDTFRNMNGMIMCLSKIDYLFSNGKVGLENTSELFREMVEMYLNNRSEFDKILAEAKEGKTESVLPEISIDSNESASDDNIASFDLSQDYSYTKPRWFRYKDQDEQPVNSWANLYSEVMIWLALDYPGLFYEGMSIYGGKRIDIFHKSESSKLYRCSELTDDLVIDTNYSANNLMIRIAAMASYLGLTENDIEIHYSRLDNNCIINVKGIEDGSEIGKIGYLFDIAQDCTNTKPQWFRYKDHDKVQVNKWAKLYVQLMRLLNEDYPGVLTAGMSILSGSNNTDILRKSDSDKMYRSAQLSDDLVIETNISANGLMKRIAIVASKVGLTEKDIEISYVVDKMDQSTPELVDTVSGLIRDSSSGLTINEICERLPNYNKQQIIYALKECHAIHYLDKYYHRDNIYGYQEMADTLLEVISRQFSQNGDYTSAKQLFKESKSRLDDFDFFYYNKPLRTSPDKSHQGVYDLAVHLFEQEKYKGNSFIFARKGMHIWKEEPDYPKDYYGLLIKYAREHGNTFTREEAISYLEDIGSMNAKVNFSNIIYTTGSKSFLQYDENMFVLADALEINDDFLKDVSAQISNLLGDDDYIATGEIDDYFYTTLHKLPSGIYWSVWLLEDILRIYDTCYTTYKAENNDDKKRDERKRGFPAVIARNNPDDNPYDTRFSGVVFKEVSKLYALPKEFTASEFREFLQDRGFIRGFEKMMNIHKIVTGDDRFLWSDNNRYVIINNNDMDEY